jgi:hypothetical protein
MPGPIPCPKCGTPVPVPDMLPEAVVCPQCRAKLKIGKNAIAAGRPRKPIDKDPAPLAGSPATVRGSGTKPGMSPLWLSVIVAGIVLVTASAAVGLWWINSTDTGKAGPKDKPGDVTTDTGVPEIRITTPGNKPAPPVDPRMAIVQPAVDKGVKYLKNRVMTIGFAHGVPEPTRMGGEILPGVAALIGLTLLETGSDKDDPEILRVAEIIRGHAKNMKQIYVLSTSLFFLNRWNEVKKLSPADRKLAQSLSLRIISGQLSTGVWPYSGFVLGPPQEERMLAALEKGEYRPSSGGAYSVSNSQFAMLALWGARHHGVPVKDTLLLTASHFNGNQQPDGHWIYSDAEPGFLWTTSTVAGLISLAIEKALLQDKEFAGSPAKDDPKGQRADIDRGFQFVAKSIGRKKGDPGGSAAAHYRGTIFGADAWGDLYFLWSVERLGVIYRRETFAKDGINWYDWGYKIVLQQQRNDGSWNDKHGPLVDTCFALLFLKRANIAKDLTDKLESLSMFWPGIPLGEPARKT